MVIQGIYVQGYSMYECTGIQAYSFTFGATALQCIALYRYIVIQKRSFNNPLCRYLLYNPILSIVLQVIYNPTQKRGFVLRFEDVVECAANRAMAMGLGCTADFQTINHPNCSFSFSLLSKMGDCRQSAMSSPWNRCDVLSFKQRSHRSLRNAKIRGFVIPEV